MNAIQTIITEHVDDIPLLLKQMQQMALPALIDQYFPAHGNWQGSVRAGSVPFGSAPFYPAAITASSMSNHGWPVASGLFAQ
jgi:hypothetical protein